MTKRISEHLVQTDIPYLFQTLEQVNAKLRDLEERIIKLEEIEKERRLGNESSI